jgi:hypothetical protein
VQCITCVMMCAGRANGLALFPSKHCDSGAISSYTVALIPTTTNHDGVVRTKCTYMAGWLWLLVYALLRLFTCLFSLRK